MIEPGMNDVSRILSEIGPHDPVAAERLLPLVYDELRKLAAARMANERADHTLGATALVHEAYLRPVGDQHFGGWRIRAAREVVGCDGPRKPSRRQIDRWLSRSVQGVGWRRADPS
jgi:hypothetical protein